MSNSYISRMEQEEKADTRLISSTDQTVVGSRKLSGGPA